MPPSNGNVDFDEQTQVLVYSHASQPLPAGTQSDALAAPDTAQHVQQAVQVKRKRGRPRKVPLKPGPVPAASPISLLLSSTGAGTGAMQQTNGPHSLPDAQITLNPAAPASQSSAAEAAVPAMPAVPAVPAGALMPHKRNSTSGQTDTGKLPKSRSKAQLPTSSMVLAHRIASGAIVPESTNTVLAGAQPTYPPAHHTAAAAESAETAAAAAVAMAAVVSPKTGAEDEAAAAVVTAAGLETGPESGRTAAALDSEAASVSESKGGREPATEDCKQASAAEVTGSPVWMGSTAAAQWQQLPDASAATLSGLRSPTASSGGSS